jgi:hypothetical protein
VAEKDLKKQRLKKIALTEADKCCDFVWQIIVANSGRAKQRYVCKNCEATITIGLNDNPPKQICRRKPKKGGNQEETEITPGKVVRMLKVV